MGKSVCAKHDVAYEVECPYCEPAPAAFPLTPTAYTDAIKELYPAWPAPMPTTDEQCAALAKRAHGVDAWSPPRAQYSLSPRWGNIWGCVCGNMTIGKPENCTACGKPQ